MKCKHNKRGNSNKQVGTQYFPQTSNNEDKELLFLPGQLLRRHNKVLTSTFRDDYTKTKHSMSIYLLHLIDLCFVSYLNCPQLNRLSTHECLRKNYLPLFIPSHTFKYTRVIMTSSYMESIQYVIMT